MRPAAGRFVNYGDRKAVNDGYSDRCSRTSRTARSRAMGSIFLGMTYILQLKRMRHQTWGASPIKSCPARPRDSGPAAWTNPHKDKPEGRRCKSESHAAGHESIIYV